MKKFISKSELNTQKTDNKNTHYVGEIYPQIFFNDEKFFQEGVYQYANRRRGWNDVIAW